MPELGEHSQAWQHHGSRFCSTSLYSTAFYFSLIFTARTLCCRLSTSRVYFFWAANLFFATWFRPSASGATGRRQNRRESGWRAGVIQPSGPTFAEGRLAVTVSTAGGRGLLRRPEQRRKRGARTTEVRMPQCRQPRKQCRSGPTACELWTNEAPSELQRPPTSMARTAHATRSVLARRARAQIPQQLVVLATEAGSQWSDGAIHTMHLVRVLP